MDEQPTLPAEVRASLPPLVRAYIAFLESQIAPLRDTGATVDPVSLWKRRRPRSITFRRHPVGELTPGKAGARQKSKRLDGRDDGSHCERDPPTDAGPGGTRAGGPGYPRGAPEPGGARGARRAAFLEREGPRGP